MKIKRFFLLISVMCFSLLFTACGEPLYTMTEEEEAVITAYASKTVSKFNKNQTTGIANARVKPGELDDEYAPDETDSEETEEAIDEENTEVEYDPETGEPIVTDETEEGTAEEGSEDAGYSMTDAIEIPGVEFTCAEFDVAADYKTNNFVLSQVSGKKYVVLSIEAKNTSDSSVDFSKYTGRTYNLSLNGGAKESTQYTPLSNDLANYDGILAAGESKSFILVFLFSDSSVENISSLELFITSDGTTRGTTI
ncbi:hypothetical protein [Pseudobutyrivibrio ruminis]|uniref:DUF4352 domain-containing protein n=1 Tax=Pseudobutyrivibrio ruminis DSM 9787 TaxID=1123011 RepID=A0A285RDC2_9FIRM|nr:hypothetical protein [Pseudobutyrivibrio ruminis]SOB91758.1 hypothetical protein SAMN02910411_0804 [Pseudobutyrivibrio ruminis DSM 9787]